MTLAEKQADLQYAAGVAERVFEQAQSRSRQAQLEIESAARAKIDAEKRFTDAMHLLANFKNYFDPEKN